REAPVFWHDAAPPQRGFWAITRHADVVRIHHDVRTFSSEVGAVSIEDLDPEQVEIRKSLIDTDPPRHTQLRGHLNRHFTPRSVAGLESLVRHGSRRDRKSTRLNSSH